MMQVPLHVAKVLSLAISLLCSLLTVPLSVAYGRQLAGQWAALLQDWAFLGGLQPAISPELQQRYRPAFLPSPPARRPAKGGRADGARGARRAAGAGHVRRQGRA